MGEGAQPRGRGPAGLSIRTLGAVDVALDGTRLDIRSTKALALLAYLAETGHGHDRSSLAGLLWPDRSETAARNNLRQVLHTLRKLIPDHLDASADRVGLRGEVAIDTRSISASTYGGRFLAGLNVLDSDLFDQWVARTAARYEIVALARFAEEAEAHLAAGRIADGLAAATRIIDIEPWNEAGHRLLIRLLHAGGRTAEAVDQYDRCADALWQHVGVRPDLETEALVAKIARHHTPAPDTPAPDRAAADHAAPAPPVHVPATRLYGRDGDIGRLVAMLGERDTRLLSLVGPGGVGKTRLAMAVADAAAPSFGDGVATANLEGVEHPIRVAAAVASALGFVRTSDERPADDLAAMLADRHQLLVIDNAEHVVDGVAELCDAVLRHAPRVWMLVTSRARLDLAAECIEWVTGLSTDPQGDEPSPAHQLFVERASRVMADAPAIDHIDDLCRHVGGLPLAVELAARLSSRIPPSELLDQLRRGDEPLVTSMRDVPERHRSMTTLLDRALDAVDDELVSQLCRLSVCRRGFDRAAAAALAGATSLSLDQLAARSLVSRRGDRYELHELIRQRAARLLGENAADLVAAHDAHMEHHLAVLADGAGPMVRAHGRSVVDRLEPDFDNIAAAWQRAVDHGRADLIRRAQRGLEHLTMATGRRSDGMALLRMAITATDGVLHAELVGALLQNSWARESFDTVRSWYEHAVGEVAGDDSDRATLARIRLNTWFGLATAELSHDLRAGFGVFEEADAMLDELDELDASDERAWLDMAWSKLLVEANDHDGVEEMLNAALAHFETTGDVFGQAEACNRLAQFHVERYEVGPAIAVESRCLDLFTQLGMRVRCADLMLNHAGTHQLCGNWRETERLTRASMVEHAAAGERFPVPYADCQLAIARAGLGARGEAEQLFTRGIALLRERDYLLALRLMLPEWGRFLHEQGRHEQAVSVLDEAHHLWSQTGNRAFCASVAALRARAVLALGHRDRAQREAREAWTVLHNRRGDGFPFPIRSIVDCATVVGETDPDHDAMLTLARDLARDVLATLPDPHLRRCFFELPEIERLDLAAH